MQHLPGETILIRRMGGGACALGVLAAAILWVAAPGEVVTPALFAATIVLTAALGLAGMLAPWERLGGAWLQAPVGVGMALCTLAGPNTGGHDSPISAFFFVILLALAYAGTLRQVLAWGGIALLLQLAPIAYEDVGSMASIVASAVVRGLAAITVAIALQRMRQRLRAAAVGERAAVLRDALTGIAGAEALADRLAAELARARRRDEPLSVVAIELEDGTATASPRRLRAAASAIDATLRGEDLAGRDAGGGFLIVLPGADAACARRVAARLLAALDRLAGSDGVRWRLGVASLPDDGPGANDLREAALRSAAGKAAGHPPCEQACAEERGVRWPVATVCARVAALGALAVAAWFVLPLVAPATAVRPVLLVALLLTLTVEVARTGRYVRGRERRGWWLMSGAAVLSAVPRFGALALVMFAIGALEAGGRGWRRDPVRAVDAAIAGIAIVGLFYSLLLLPALDDGRLEGVAVLTAVTAAIGSAAALSAALIVVVTITPRRRPDIALLLLAIAASSLMPLPYVLVEGATRTMHHTWEAVVLLLPLPGIAGAVLRRRAPPRGMLVDAPDAHPAIMLWVGTGLMAALILSTIAVHGDMPAVVAVAVLGTMLLRAARAALIEHQRARYATLARRSDAVVAAQQQASLEALARALEARDGYTGRHGEETVEIAVRVAAQLGLDEAEVEEVRTVALLHDIGKIGIPNDILHKEGPLDEEEWERMREHPVIGERILRAVPGLEHVADAVRHEHERWDGGGYPDGIAGEAIPLPSRITLVCDAWHAMTSDRPYRRAMPLEHAVAQVLEHAGRQFDRAVVRALLEVLEADGIDARPVADGAAA